MSQNREISLLRNYDEEAEKIVRDFLIDNFYSKYANDYQIITDKNKQVKGVDSIFKYNDYNYICDEKSAIRYINKNLQTFCFELSFIDKSNAIHDGWLFDTNKINNSFLIIWLDKCKNNCLKTKDDINEIQIALIKKYNIIIYLNTLNWTIDKIKNKDNKIRTNKSEFLGNIFDNKIKFSFSKQLVEKPINILIPRTKLLEISDFNAKLIK